jgi:predicted nucleic acid-binding protein
VVLDTSFVVNVLHENEGYHRPCLAFANRLIRDDVLIVYSSLLRLEFWHGWARAVRNRGVPRAIVEQPSLLPEPASERARAFAIGDRYLKDFLAMFRGYEIRIGARVLDEALRLMSLYNLGSHDACMAAIAFRAGVPDLVSLDRKFRRVDGIQLWNNHIS